MTHSERDTLLLEMHGDVREMKTKLGADYRALYGNGKPGLIEKVEGHGNRLTALEKGKCAEEQTSNKHVGVVAWVISTIITAAAVVVAWLK